ncbi:XRE family transcriptional regulator [Streptosporangium sp. NPDC051023]|uniref:XRE family transcriptional regulator n=1 Tax=Streptosporangium sp. NPDC051023 TaxID=3155410 RepID=UPI00344C3FB8
MPNKAPNVQLRAWRNAQRLTRLEVAEKINATPIGIAERLTCDEERVRRWETGEVRWPSTFYRLALTQFTGLTPEQLGFSRAVRDEARKAAVSISVRNDHLVAPDALAAEPRTVDLADYGEDEGEMRRREFVGLTGAALFSAVLHQPEPSQYVGHDVDDLAVALLEHSSLIDGPADLTSIAAMVAQAKRSYQASRYSQVITGLPSLIRTLRAACSTLDSDDRLRAHALSAEAHHIAASILLKQENKGLAWLAADRSVLAAHASQSPLAIGSSSRVITRALMDGAHHRVAISTANAAAARMDADLKQPSGDELSIYGSLLLSGAVAAAQTGNRHVTVELLDEAAQAARRLGYDGNHQWTSFGPSNVLCHRVNVALRLGDAGTAIDHARQIDLDRLSTNERKGTLLIDTAQAFLMCGKHDKALQVLRAAGQIAAEEVTGRPAALRLVRDLTVTAPISLRREAREYATSLGVVA